jgi:hypothetical protein
VPPSRLWRPPYGVKEDSRRGGHLPSSLRGVRAVPAARETKGDPEVGFRFHPHGYGMAERIAETLGVRLVAIGVEPVAVSGHPIPGQEGGYQT